MSRTWAQVAGAGVSTPSPLRQSITIPASPSTSPPRPCPPGAPGVSGGVLSPAGGQDALHDGGGGAGAAGGGGGLALDDHNELAQGVQYTWAEDEEGGGVAPNFPGSNNSSSSPSSSTNTTTTTNNNNSSNMVNAKRMEKKAEKARTAAAAADAVELSFGALAPAAEPAKAAASTSVAEARKKRKEEKAKAKAKAKAKREEKGKCKEVESSLSDEDEAPGGTSTEVMTKVEVAAGAAESKEEALKRAMLASLERSRRRELFSSPEVSDLTIEFAKDGLRANVHREVIVAESTWFAERLPPADENGETFYVLSEWSSNMMGPIITFLYTGALPGCVLNTTYKWDLRFVQFGVTTYRPAAALGIQSVMKYILGNIEEAVKFYTPTLNGRLYHYKFQRPESMANFEIPLRLSYICLYQEKHNPEAMRQMKLQIAKLFVAVMPFLRRQGPFKTLIDRYWTALPFPWREDMFSFHVEGVLPEYPKLFNSSGKWTDEEDDSDEQDKQQQHEEQNIGVPGPSSGAPAYYAATIDEIVRRTEAAGFKVT